MQEEDEHLPPVLRRWRFRSPESFPRRRLSSPPTLSQPSGYFLCRILLSYPSPGSDPRNSPCRGNPQESLISQGKPVDTFSHSTPLRRRATRPRASSRRLKPPVPGSHDQWCPLPLLLTTERGWSLTFRLAHRFRRKKTRTLL
ncbi:hypothetical protein V8G54_023545 [Vigna mungo]|uniref:Uncharacterized protein n=1 Tax=Vigna mungo TaxID=3915 RepID=A0AAQ3RPB0_VIGMU